ncbi:hypothetical protein PybrP1_000651, partial [[Pythium] brassicae (nom. inval.)]
MFPLAIAAVSQLRVTFARLDKYLASDELSASLASYTPTAFERSDRRERIPLNGTISIASAQFEWSRQQLATPVESSLSPPSKERQRTDALTIPPAFGFYLDAINLRIGPGELVMIVGPVGSGKTSLISAILGEMVAMDGSVNVQGKTRLLVLNSHYDLLAHADRVLVVQDGRIAGDGTYAEMLSQFPELLSTPERPRSPPSLPDNYGGELDHSRAESDAELPRTPTSDTENSRVVQVPDEHRRERDAHADFVKLVADEDRVKGKVSKHIYAAYFDETGFNGTLVVLVLFVSFALSQFLRVLVDWWQGHWAKNMSHDGVDPSYSRTWFGMWYLGLLMLTSVVTICRSLLTIE